MSRLIARFSDFSKGDAGFVDKTKVQDGFFSGENVVPYRDGSIGPRSGFLGLAGAGAAGLPAGTVYDLGYVDMGNTGPEYVWMRKGTALVRIPVYNAAGLVITGQSWHAAAGAFTGATNGDHVDYDLNTTLFTIFGDQGYHAEWDTGGNGTLTAVATIPGGGCMEIFGDFLVIANIPSHPNRLVWSSPSNYASFPAANFLDIGNAALVTGGAPTIRAIRRVRDQLLVWTDTGQLFIITGTLGENETVREYMHGDLITGPAGPYSVVRARDGSVWWTRREEVLDPNESADVFPSAQPVSYLGGQRQDVPALGGYLLQTTPASNRWSDTGGVCGRSDRSVVLVDHQLRMLLLRDGAWSRHNLPLSAGNYRVTAGSRGEMYGVDATGVLNAWLFEWERPPNKFRGTNQERVPYSVEQLDGTGVTTPAWFATPEFRTADFGLIVVETIEVLFTNHLTNDTVNSHFDVFLQQYDVVDTAEVINPASRFPADNDSGAGGAMVASGVTIGMEAPFDEAPPVRDTRRRMTFHPLEAAIKPAPGVRVMIRNLRGISVHEILVFGTIGSGDRP